MKLDPKKYDEMVKNAAPPSPVWRDCVWAFCVGGLICTVGEALRRICSGSMRTPPACSRASA